MARCTDCDTLLTDLDRAAMRRIDDEYAHWGATPPYAADDADPYCTDCLDRQAERAQERRDSDYYGGDSPTLAETAAMAMRFK